MQYRSSPDDIEYKSLFREMVGVIKNTLKGLVAIAMVIACLHSVGHQFRMVSPGAHSNHLIEAVWFESMMGGIGTLIVGTFLFGCYLLGQRITEYIR